MYLIIVIPRCLTISQIFYNTIHRWFSEICRMHCVSVLTMLTFGLGNQNDIGNSRICVNNVG